MKSAWTPAKRRYTESLRRALDQLAAAASRVSAHWKLVGLLALLLMVLSIESPPPMSIEARLDRALTGRQFDFVSWEIRTIWQKLTHGLLAPQRAMNEGSRSQFVLRYLDLVGEAQHVEGQINRVYADPNIEDPRAAAAQLRARRDSLRASIRARQPVAEAIVEEQVATVLTEEGFGFLGQDLPPVKMHFTPLPQLLVISPRDRIERSHQLSLEHGLSTSDRETIEESVDKTFDVSSLVTAIGGLSAYPSMLLESSSINWAADVTAHEWTHHYLGPRPLGRSYQSSGEARTINETVASIVGREVGRRVVARYYPEHVQPRTDPELPATDNTPPDPNEEPAPPAFDFRMEMRKTRIRVDHLLAQGRIDDAERYMEARRKLFVENGYAIRKLNQAYFAFHGAYADQPGAAGEDPIGPRVRAIHALSADLHLFVSRLSGVTSLEELDTLLGNLEQQASSQVAAVSVAQGRLIGTVQVYATAPDRLQTPGLPRGEFLAP